MMKQNFLLKIVLKKSPNSNSLQKLAFVSLTRMPNQSFYIQRFTSYISVWRNEDAWCCPFIPGSWCLASGMHIYSRQRFAHSVFSAQLSWSYRALGLFIWSPTQHCVIGNCCEKKAFTHLSTCLWLWDSAISKCLSFRARTHGSENQEADVSFD